MALRTSKPTALQCLGRFCTPTTILHLGATSCGQAARRCWCRTTESYRTLTLLRIGGDLPDAAEPQLQGHLVSAGELSPPQVLWPRRSRLKLRPCCRCYRPRVGA